MPWADDFDERHGVPSATPDMAVATYGAPGASRRPLRAMRYDEEEDQ